jgi:hypothetical protein
MPILFNNPDSKFSPQLLTALGTGLLSGNTWNEQLANAGLGANTALAAQQQKQLTDATKNRTVQMLQTADPELANAVAAGTMTPTEAFAAHLKKQQEAAKLAQPDYMSVNGLIFDKNSKQWIQPPADMVNSQNEYGLNPQTYTDANGNPVLVQVGKNGQAIQTKVPPGLTLSKKPIEIDTATSTILLDPVSRQKIGEIPKDLAGAEKQKAEGKLTGEAAKALPATLAKADSAIKTIDEALAEKSGLHRSTGLYSMFPTVPGSDSANFQASLKKIQGATFIQAYQDLRGTGAISEVEGAKAEDAIAALSVAQDEDHMKKALNDLREVIVAGKERAKLLAGQPPASDNSATNVMTNPNVTNPANISGKTKNGNTFTVVSP